MTFRPSTGLKFSWLANQGPGPGHSTEESLRVYGTVAFGIDMMIEHIHIAYDKPGHVDATKWFSMVPDAYRDGVLDVASRVTAAYLGEGLTEDSVYRLVNEISSEIWRQVRPVRFGDPSEEQNA